MKKFTRISILSALSTVVLLQSPAAEFATTNAQPRDNWWLERHQQKLQEVATRADEIDLVFIGDSITHFMDDRAPGLVERTFPGMKHLNLGYSADRTENVLWRLQNGELDGLSPEVVVLMIGTNNTGHRQDPPAETLGGIQRIIDELMQRLPEAKVLLLSVFPRGEAADDPLRQLNAQINSQLPRLADQQTVFHLDINEVFLDADGRLPKEVMPDLLHPNQKGYELWLSAIQSKVEELRALQKLPTPPEVWADYEPNAGDFNEEIVSERTAGGIYYRESYISAYVNGEAVRVYCKYAVKEGLKNAPGLLDVHGWMGRPNPDMSYVHDGWAVLSHDYSGITSRAHYTKYPEALAHGYMEAKQMGHQLIYSRMPDGSQLTNPKATSHYLWNAIQRRALSYLATQEEVDRDRLGAKGYSYGGTIMWNLAMDPRVKAVVAHFGIGWIEYYRNRGVFKYKQPFKMPEATSGEALFLSALAPQAHAPYINAACLWLNGSNDHHGGHERALDTFTRFKPGVPWDFAVQARGHHNVEKLGKDCKLWLEKHVLGRPHFWPARPESEIKLGSDGVPELHLAPASAERIKALDVYQCLKTANNIERYWRDVQSVREGDTWITKLPVMHVDDYLFSYANIRYENDSVVSSDFKAVIPSQLGQAKATDRREDALPGGADQWTYAAPAEGVGGVEGFRPINNQRGSQSKQFADPKWKAPEGADLRFKFYCTQPQSVILEVNGQYAQRLEITASNDWQTMQLPAADLVHQHNQQSMNSWSGTQSVAIKPVPGSDITQIVFADFEWSGPSRVEKAAELELIDGKLYLTAEMAETVDSFWRVMQDKSVSGTAIRIAGVEYERGLGVHADSVLSFDLNGGFSTFHVVPGPDDAHRGQLEMVIRLDGREVYRSGAMNRDSVETVQPVVLPVKGAQKLTLIVESLDGNNGGDHANWAEAYLKR